MTLDPCRERAAGAARPRGSGPRRYERGIRVRELLRVGQESPDAPSSCLNVHRDAARHRKDTVRLRDFRFFHFAFSSFTAAAEQTMIGTVTFHVAHTGLGLVARTASMAHADEATAQGAKGQSWAYVALLVRFLIVPAVIFAVLFISRRGAGAPLAVGGFRRGHN
jgi:hypothetical protein